MLGAIYGDIIGSRFEFDRGGKTTKFELFTREDDFTDDTVMTVAVADALLSAGKNASVEEIQNACIEKMQYWGRKYPYAGYGNRFIHWLREKTPKPYGSYGNGSAMRVAAAGWLYDTLERTIEAAGATAVVSHNHPEGMKGAECTAAVIFLARTGITKDDIREYVETAFGYELTETLEELRARHAHVESCQDSLPKALTSFFNGDSYEAVVRNAVSLGGDTDTIAAIAGSMAEAYYGIPGEIEEQGNKYLPIEFMNVIHAFKEAVKNAEDEPNYGNNEYIKYAVAKIYEENQEKDYLTLLDVLVKRMMEEGDAPTPMVDVENVLDSINIEEMQQEDTFTLNAGMRLKIDTMQDEQGNLFIPLFTDHEEREKGNTANIILNVPIYVLLEEVVQAEDIAGLVINPFGQSMVLPKNIVEIVLNHYKEISENANQ